MAVIVWKLELQLPMESVPITTDQGEVYSIMGYSLTITCDSLVVLSGPSGFLLLHQ